MTYIRSYMPGHRVFITPPVMFRRPPVTTAASPAQPEMHSAKPDEARLGGKVSR